MIRRLLVGACALSALAATLSLSQPVAAAVLPPQGKVGPHEIFGALVNGSGGVASPAPIRMACFGPLRPGETGHPMAGQTLEVFRPEAIVGSFGNTGPRAHQIVVIFGPPPPSASTGAVTFRYYGVPKAIPTSLVLPCTGGGYVSFVPLPMLPPSSRPAVVRVSFLSQP